MLRTSMKRLVFLLAIGLVLLAAGIATPQSAPKKAERDPHTARVGDLQVTVTAAGAVSSNLFQPYRIPIRPGYHFVVVKVKFKNLGSYPNCYSPSPWLRVDLGFNYSGTTYPGPFKGPETYDLQPSDESGGFYVFQAKDGTHPVALKLVRSTLNELGCRNWPHQHGEKPPPDELTFSLRNLPEPAN